MRVITAAVNKLHKRATAAATRKDIVTCLTKLGNLEKQSCSLTIDNVSNVSKVGELMRSDFALAENFADQNEENECNAAEASANELWEDIRCAVYVRLPSSVLFALLQPQKVVLKVRKVAKNSQP